MLFGNPGHTQSMIACYDFHRVFLEIPVKNYIVGMLLTCPISKSGFEAGAEPGVEIEVG